MFNFVITFDIYANDICHLIMKKVMLKINQNKMAIFYIS